MRKSNSFLHLACEVKDPQTSQYRQTLALRWDVNPKDTMQIEENAHEGLVGVPLVEANPSIDMDTDTNLDSSSDGEGNADLDLPSAD